MGHFGLLKNALKHIFKSDLAINVGKSVLSPRRGLTYLGFEIDLGWRLLKVAGAMRNKLLQALDHAARSLGLAAKFWQRLAALDLPAFCTQLALAGRARVTLLAKALPKDDVRFDKTNRKEMFLRRFPHGACNHRPGLDPRRPGQRH